MPKKSLAFAFRVLLQVFVFEKMPKNLSKRAIEGRKWRIAARGKRRLNAIVSEYIRLKQRETYDMCLEFYCNVKEKYSEKQNLTKTVEFRHLVCVSREVQPSSGDEPVETVEVNRSLVEDQTDTRGDEPVETVEVNQPLVEDQTVTIGDTYVEQGLIINQYIVQPEQDVLSEAINDTLNVIDDGIDHTQDMDAIINDIIRDIEIEEPAFFENSIPQDEGIELSYEDEVDRIMHGLEMDMYDL